MKTLKISELINLAPILDQVRNVIENSLQGGPVEIRIMRESKTRDQESKYNAMISDIADTVKLDGRYYGAKIWKACLVDEFERVRVEMGEPLTHPGKTVLSLDGRRVITVRPSTRQFQKREASDFIEFLYATASEYGATFSEIAPDYEH